VYDTVDDHRREAGHRWSHDRPCPRCGHAIHLYLACSETCRCRPST